MTKPDIRQPAHPAPASQPDWDDLTEDIFGLNIRAARTVWDLLIRPAKVFTAARTADWTGAYTPTFRVFFSLIAIMFLFKFFWAGEDAMIRAPFEAAADKLQAAEPGIDTEYFILTLMDRNWILYPFAIGFWAITAAVALNIWGKGTSLVTRVRLYFAAVIPSTVLTVLWTITSAKLPGSIMWMSAVMTVIVTLLADGVTTWRGLAPVHAGFQRIWRAILLGLFTTAVSMAASVTSSIGAGLWTGGEIERELERLKGLETSVDAPAPSDMAAPL